MNKDVFITDDRLTFTKLLSNSLKDEGYKVVLTKEVGNEGLAWKRNSPFALQHINVLLKNIGSSLETAIINFDVAEYSKIYPCDSILDVDKACSELITANTNLVFVLQSLMLEKQEGRLIFVLRTGEEFEAQSPILQTCASAFTKLAESTALYLASKKLPQVQTLLVRLENPDEASGKWLVSQLDSALLSRSTGKWTKAGTRGLFAK